MLYECIAGLPPFTGATTTDIIASILKTAPAPLKHHVPDVPAKLEEITTRALEKDREGRYQGVKDLLVDLRRLKKRIEFEAEMERSVSPDSHSAPTVIIDSPITLSPDGKQFAVSLGHSTQDALLISETK